MERGGGVMRNGLSVSATLVYVVAMFTLSASPAHTQSLQELLPREEPRAAPTPSQALLHSIQERQRVVCTHALRRNACERDFEGLIARAREIDHLSNAQIRKTH